MATSWSTRRTSAAPNCGKPAGTWTSTRKIGTRRSKSTGTNCSLRRASGSALTKVHLVDGTYELYRAHFGAPRAEVKGREVGATRGILRSLLSLVRDDRVSHIAVAFDHVIESFRNELFSGYKTGEGVPEELMSQFTLAADTRSGLRPSFTPAAPPEMGSRLFDGLVELAAGVGPEQGVRVESGRFGADMQLHLVNDGPVTIWVDTATA